MKWIHDEAIAEQRRLIRRLWLLRMAEWALIVWCGWCAGRQLYQHHWLWAACLIAVIVGNGRMLHLNHRVTARCIVQIARLQRWEVPA